MTHNLKQKVAQAITQQCHFTKNMGQSAADVAMAVIQSEQQKLLDEASEFLEIMIHTAETYFNLLGGMKHPQQYIQLQQSKDFLAKLKHARGDNTGEAIAQESQHGHD